MSWTKSILAALVACGLLIGSFARAAETVDPQAYEKVVTNAIEYLKKTQTAEGAWSPQAGPGITALVVTGIIRTGRGPNDPMVAKALKYLEAAVQEDGGLSKADTHYRNYETSLAILAFKAANKDGQYNELIKKCNAFVLATQWDETTDVQKDNLFYGGAGYGKSKRPDMSNTTFMLDALKEVGGKENDEAIQRALVFISRCQNLETEHNTTPFAAKVNDGGFYYTPAGGGNSAAGPTENGGLRSYAAMTYAGLKSFLYADVKADDPRVKAAKAWIAKNYDLKKNGGMDPGDSGLYYYYHTFSKCMAALKSDTFTDAAGKEHNWKVELFQELASRQQPDGSWVNSNKRWLESDPILVTGYVLLSLDSVKPTAK